MGTKYFGRKKYRSVQTYRQKKLAYELAEHERDYGKNARVKKTTRGYTVYVRKK